ncbi:hypothetical protein GIB67_011939 [Kingdonia uniflora]|uniref:Uncharacterized protein n=1 Tax=Kingdonia uniflora TaxID=39325 RepID=A0A7J7M036_9MAGN|nr:hypothetical protein GIB67_011939 [Kingdonia uniflora]
MLRTKTPLPTEHWPFISKGNGKGISCPSPHTPKAPEHGLRPYSHYKVYDAQVRQITIVLFQESAFPQRCILPLGLPKSVCKSFPSNRALFCEDELCQALSLSLSISLSFSLSLPLSLSFSHTIELVLF